MIVLYLASEGKLSEFSPMMLIGAMGWFGLLAVPALSLVAVPIALARNAMGLNAATWMLLMGVSALSFIALVTQKPSDPYSATFATMFATTGLIWSVLIAGQILWRRNRTGT
jgi:hypothetical protein